MSLPRLHMASRKIIWVYQLGVSFTHGQGLVDSHIAGCEKLSFDGITLFSQAILPVCHSKAL